MRRSFYHVLVILFLVVYPLLTAIDLTAVPTLAAIHPAKALSLVLGLLLQPASAVGLWHDRTWGVVLLLLAAVLCVFSSFGAAIGAMIAIPLTIVRFLGVARGRAAQAGPHGGPMPPEQ